MEEQTSFYYTLVSNASMNAFSDNKPQNFRNCLSRPLNLEGDWEVGMSTVIYPHSWTNIKAVSYLKVFVPVKSLTNPLFSTINVNITLGQLQFNHMEDLIKYLNETINKEIEDEITKQNIEHDYINNNETKYPHCEFQIAYTLPMKIRMVYYGKYRPNTFKLILPGAQRPARDLWRKLGFDDSVVELKEGQLAQHPASFSLHFPALFLYTNIIENVGVGDTQAPLLSLVPIKGRPGEIVYERYDKPQYYKVIQNHLSTIEISIKDDTGEDIRFLIGKTIIQLHFRRRA